METIKKTIYLLLLIFGMMGITQQKATAQVSVSFQLFYDNLSVHGSWINDPNYGYVWAPNVGAGFAPYRTNGHWVYTDYGWTWASNYSWGWAPFHYGRWFYDPFYGWLWVPDTIWAPAWVTWRYYDGYYGWAAIGPGISIDIAFGSSYSVPYNQWCFVRERDFGRRNISNYYVNTSNNTTIINNSTVINNIQTSNGNRYNAGPGRDHVQKRTGNAPAQVHLKERDKPGQKISRNELQLYKPHVERDNNNRKAVPAKVMDRKDFKPVSERKAEPRVNRPQRSLEKAKEQPARQKENLERRAQQRQQEMQRNEQRTKERELKQRQQEVQRNEQRMRDQETERRKLEMQRNEQRFNGQQLQRKMDEPLREPQRIERSRINSSERMPRIEHQNRRQGLLQRNNTVVPRQMPQSTDRVLPQGRNQK
ncbi:DUF6600 domain-containing protein [Flavobacterium enshiense]|uniref:DUF6600 domain-containing protein n=1 Tax=Flavobacterium enshiense TaxID=1341165 RepID=UPI00345D1992